MTLEQGALKVKSNEARETSGPFNVFPTTKHKTASSFYDPSMSKKCPRRLTSDN